MGTALKSNVFGVSAGLRVRGRRVGRVVDVVDVGLVERRCLFGAGCIWGVVDVVNTIMKRKSARGIRRKTKN